MIKYALSIFVCTMMISLGHAQYVGIKGGLTLSNLNIDEVNDRNIRTGFHFGAYAHLPLTDIFAFQPEINYTTKGATADFDIPFFSGEYSFNLNYVDVPLMGVVKFGDAAELHLGPYIGFLTKASLETTGAFADGQEELDRDSFKDMDLGLAAGLALNFDALQLGARYHYGLNKIAKTDAAETFLGDARHSYLQVYAALRIQLQLIAAPKFI